jgi:hypothetical protein
VGERFYIANELSGNAGIAMWYITSPHHAMQVKVEKIANSLQINRKKIKVIKERWCDQFICCIRTIINQKSAKTKTDTV